jgi:hypothetical protein
MCTDIQKRGIIRILNKKLSLAQHPIAKGDTRHLIKVKHFTEQQQQGP